MRVRAFLLPLALTVLACGGATASTEGGGENSRAGGGAAPQVPAHPVAVELFTSQGCSSCLPADAVMGKLARQDDVVAITRPVTYWDQLGWKDTLARPANTELQRAYRKRGFPGAGVYTPQSVVQGRTGFVGGSEARIRGAIVRLSRTPEPKLAISRRPDGGLTLALSGRYAGGAVTVVALRNAVTVRVGRGENGGRSLTYYNVLLGETPVGRWSGGKATLAIPAGAVRVAGADRYAVIVRDGAAGPILAARYL